MAGLTRFHPAWALKEMLLVARIVKEWLLTSVCSFMTESRATTLMLATLAAEAGVQRSEWTFPFVESMSV
jgi:hypothetical protein